MGGDLRAMAKKRRMILTKLKSGKIVATRVEYRKSVVLRVRPAK